jgi:hypothetical protein
MRFGKKQSNYTDPLLARSTANAQYPLGFRERGNVAKTDGFTLLEDLRQLRESCLSADRSQSFSFQEVHEKLSATTIRVQSVQNGFVAEVKHIEVSIHSETIFVSNPSELFDTLNPAERLLNRVGYKGRY